MAARSQTYPSRLPPEFTLDQDVFLADYFDAAPGHHVSMIGPNGGGKTTLGMKIMAKLHQLHPETTGVALVMKPHKGPKGSGRSVTGDPTVARLARALKSPMTRTWPPNPGAKVLHAKRETPFWTLWPIHSKDFRADLARHRYIFERALLDAYNDGRHYVFADEVHSLVNQLRLGDVLEHIWSKGRSMETALVAATQRPAMVPRFMYSSARHLFLWRDPDADARKRYAEISGMDPKRLVALTDGLRQHECLYVHPESDTLACLTPGGFLADPRPDSTTRRGSRPSY